MLTKDQILSANDRNIQEIEVPEWGGTVYIRNMTGGERDAYEMSLIKMQGRNMQADLANARAKLCAICICDQDGNRLFTDDEVQELSKKSASALDRVYEQAEKLNGLKSDEIEGLVKN